MALTVSDGGGGAPKPTTTPPSSGDSRDAAKARGSRPTLLDDALRPGTSRSGRGARPTGTSFTSRPAADPSATPTIDSAVRERVKPRPTTPSTKPERTKPGASAPTSTPAKEREDAPAANDGRTDGELRSDSHEGSRDKEIQRLKKDQAALAKERTRIEGEIDKIEEDIDTTEGRAGTVGTVVDVVTSPVTAVASLFGRSNPISDAAESAAESLMGLNDDKKRLEETERSLAAQEREIAEQIEKLEQEVVLNAITTSMYAVGADEYNVDVMDGEVREIEVVDDKDRARIAQMSGGDAAYMDWEDTIAVRESYVESLTGSVETLQRQGILDGDGNVVDADRLDASVAGDQLLAAGALVAVHEEEHGQQAERGEFDVNRDAMTQHWNAATQLGRRFGTEDLEAIQAQAGLQNEVYRIVLEELPAYQAQIGEAYEAWGVQRTAEGIHLTENADGVALPPAVAAARVFNFMFAGDPGDLEMQMAGRAGNVEVTPQSGGDAAGAPGDDGAPGWRSKPGEDGAPGWRSKPGEAGAPGWRSKPGSDPFEGQQLLDAPALQFVMPGTTSAPAPANVVPTDEEPANIHVELDGLSVDEMFTAISPLLAPEALDAFFGFAPTDDAGAPGWRSKPGEEGAPGWRSKPGEEGAPGWRSKPGEAGAPGWRSKPGEAAEI
jgi:hypothetical protein